MALLQPSIVRELDATLAVQAMKALLRLSTLTHLSLSSCRLNNETFNLIQPGSWLCFRHLELDGFTMKDPTVSMRALLHLTGLEKLSLKYGGITNEAINQIQPGSWRKLQVLDLRSN
jgi:hypothetical protein